MQKRLLTGIFAFALTVCCLLLAFGGSAFNSYAAEVEYTLHYPTQDEIRAKYREYQIDTRKSVTYTAEYSIAAPYAKGDISAYDRQNGLNAINFCRYIAGLPADVELNSLFNEYAQASALVNAANNVLTHYPERPSGISDELYNQATIGSSQSNIAYGYNNIADSVISGYMEDSDPSNIDRVGHRRWILNPQLKYTGFGYVGIYTATHVFDRSREESFVGDYIAWPPVNMPYELYMTAWFQSQYAFSVTLGNAYDRPNLTNVTVEVQSALLNQSWHLDQTSTSYSEYLNVENSYYGLPKCIIFNVGMFPVNDTVTVTINGITKNGISAPITYTVNFFEIDHQYSSKVTKTASCTVEGERTYTCIICGDSYTEPIEKSKHSYSALWTIDTVATCVAEGSMSHHCIYCGDRKDVTLIPKTEHTYSKGLTQAATCTEEGIEEWLCRTCGQQETHKLAIIPHNYERFFCTMCGEKDPDAPALLLGDLNGDDTISAMDYLLLKRAVLGSYDLTDDQSVAADVNWDGEVNSLDYMLVKRHVLGTYVIEW